MIRAKKGCRFAGRDYAAGAIVPESAIDKKAIGSLLRMGLIEIKPDEVKPPIEVKPVEPQPKAQLKARRQSKTD